jgi:ribosomal-protein-alanine N-acetyltransferase
MGGSRRAWHEALMAARQFPPLAPGARGLLRRLGFDRREASDLRWGRVVLRPARASDWTEWAALREASRNFLTPWESTWPEDALTRGAFLRRVRQYSAERGKGAGYYFLIRRAADAKLLGGINLTNVRRGITQSGTLGYWTGAPFVRQGYMTEAMHAVLSFAFEELRLNRVEAACLPENVASRALLARFGFTEKAAPANICASTACGRTI